MKQLFQKLLGAIVFCTLLQTTNAQTGVLDPTDPIVSYDPAHPPATPPWGQIAKWVRTKRLNWNTDSYKCYFYKGIAFRLKFPKSYQSIADGKTYPLYVFFHGIGERGEIYDNEYQLYHGGQVHSNAVDNGKFDGFLLYPQSSSSSGYFGASQYSIIYDLIVNYLIPQVKVDENRILVDGLSGGGTSTWDFTNTYPKLVAAALPISSASVSFEGYANNLKFIPIWHFQGGLDVAPSPFTSHQVGDAFSAAGANYRYTEFSTLGHGCWDSAWAMTDYFPFLSRANKINPWPLFGRTEFCPGDPINVTIGVTAGFDGYEWRKDGNVITGATSNQIIATSIGTYDCRIKRGSTWSVWSPVPVVIKIKQPTVSPSIVVSGLMSKVIPALDGNSGVNLEVPDGYATYLWQKVGSSTALSTTRSLYATTPGDYKVKVTEQFGCSSDFSSPFTVIDANGPNKPDAAINVIASTVSKTSIKLNWSDNPTPLNNETNFEIYQGAQSGGPYKLVGIVGQDVTTFTATGLNPKTNYYYKVRAINNTAAANASNEALGTTDADIQPPTAPGNLRITATTRSSISLAWDASTDDVGVTRYDLYINGVKSYVTSATQFTANNLEFGKSYAFAVKARDFANNSSPFSNQATGQALLKGLNTKYYTFTGTWNNLPDFSTLTPLATGILPNVSINLRSQDDNFAFLWEGYIRIPLNGTYTFRTNSDDGSRLYLGALGASASPYNYSATSLVNNDGLHGTQDRDGSITLTAGVYPIAMTYYEQGGGQSMTVSWKVPGSTSFVAIPDSAFQDQPVVNGQAPAKPSGLVVTATSYKQINLTWTDNSNNETGFEIWRSTNSTTGFATIGTTGPNVTSFADSSLAPSTTYYYKIRAINLYGESAFNLDGNGVNYSYYELTGLSNLPNFNSLTPKKTGRVPNFSLGMQDRGDDFQFKFDGFINITKSGTYTFYTSSDDGSKLYIDAFDEAHRVVNNDGLHGTQERGGNITLSAGLHAIYVTFFERGGGEVLTVSYQGPSGSGINKQVIPSSVLGEPLPSATTLSLPPIPVAPSNLLASGISNSSVNVTWNDNSTNESSFELYRSSNNNTSYVLLATLPANRISYLDTALFSNAIYYYKIRATNVGGNSAYSSEDSAKTANNIPVVTAIPSQYMHFGTQLQLNVSATDADAETLNLQVTGLPGTIGTFNSTGNGTGTITVNSTSTSDQGNYTVVVSAADQHGGTSSTSFQLTINSNYNPKINPISTISIDEKQASQVNLSGSDQNVSDALSWTFTGLPSFVTANSSGGSVQLNLAPGYADNGSYWVKAKLDDGNNGFDTASFLIIVNDVNPNKRVYINFNDGTFTAGAPWNNLNKVPALNDNFTNLKDETGAISNMSLKVMTPWQNIGNGTNNLGVNTNNNSGVFPDAVIRSAYWTNTIKQTINFNGLDVNSKYKFTFFGSRGSVSDNRTSTYTINGNSVLLNAANNSQNIVTLNGLQPDVNGTLSLDLQNGSGSQYAYLNAVVIEAIYDDGTVPAKPRNLAGQINNGYVKLSWTDAAYNESAYEVYRSTNLSGPYTLLNAGGNNPNINTYNDSSVSGNITYYYAVRAVNSYGTGDYSDTISVITPNVSPVINNITDVKMKTQQIVDINVVATDDPSDVITLNVTGLPSFATFTSNGNGTGVIHIAPGNTVGSFPNVTIAASDDHGAISTKTFKISVADKDITSIYVNFNQTTVQVEEPWNSFNTFPYAGKSIAALKDDNGNITNASITLVDAWDGANDVGAITGNNSGIYPDNVMQSAYYTSSTATKRIRITGLATTNTKYNLVFFASRVANDNRNTVYAVGSQSVTLNAANNTTTSVQINGIVPDASGTIEFTAQRGSGSSFGYIGAVVLQSYIDNGIPLSPSGLVVTAKSKTAIQLNWSDKSDNESGFEIYRALAFGGPYSLVTTTTANITSYLDQGLTPNTMYYYKIRAKKAPVFFSSYSNIAGASTYSFGVYVNFNRDNPAGSPWNNTNKPPMKDDVFSNLLNDQGNPSGIDMTVATDFSGDNPFGMVTGNDSGVYPDNVIRSSWWIDPGTTAQLKISGLNQSMGYTFVFFGSRDGGGDRTSVYTINDKSVSLNCSYNISQTVQIDNVRPDENGEVMITVSLGPTASFAYIGALVINGYQLSDVNAGLGNSNSSGRVNNSVTTSSKMITNIDGNNNVKTDKTVNVYPNPFRNDLVVSTNFKAKQERLSIRLVDAGGRTIYQQELKNIPAGRWSYQLNLSEKNLPIGMYLLQLQTDTNTNPISYKLLKQ